MERKRGAVIPIGEVITDLPGSVQALRKAPRPTQRHFTQADQVSQLVSASEADPERGFMARLLSLCSLPRTHPGNQKEYIFREMIGQVNRKDLMRISWWLLERYLKHRKKSRHRKILLDLDSTDDPTHG